MKLKKTASGKTIVKMSRAEWSNMGKKAGWLNKKANVLNANDLIPLLVTLWTIPRALLDQKQINNLSPVGEKQLQESTVALNNIGSSIEASFDEHKQNFWNFFVSKRGELLSTIDQGAIEEFKNEILSAPPENDEDVTYVLNQKGFLINPI